MSHKFSTTALAILFLVNLGLPPHAVAQESAVAKVSETDQSIDDQYSGEQDDPARPSAVRTINVPVVDSDLLMRLLPYESVRSATFAGFAPDGKGILIRTRFGNAAQVYRVYEPAGRREQVTFFSEPASARYIPGRDDGSMIVSMSRQGDERYQMYLLQPGEHRVSMLTDGKSRHTLGSFSADGSQVTIRSNRRNGTDMDLYVANPMKRSAMELMMPVDGEHWYVSHWSADGKEVLVRHHVSSVVANPGIFDMETKKLTMLPRADVGPSMFNNLRFSPDAKSVWMTTDAFGEFSELVRLDRKTEKYERLTSDIPWSVDYVSLHRQSGAIAFTVNEAGTSRLFVIDSSGNRREYPLKQPCIAKDLRFSPDGSQLGFTLYSPTRTEDVHTINVADGRLKRWTFSVMGGLDPDQFVEPKLIQYRAHDGQEIDAWYYRPEPASKDQPAPAIIYVHGGPESQYRPEFSSRIQFFVNQLGCAVIAPNVRGSTGYGKTFVGLDDGLRREDSVKDVGSLLDWIAEQPELDAERSVVVGRSYGGYMVLASMIHFGDRLRVGIEAAGIANFSSFLEQTEPYRQDRRRVEYGDERDAEVREFFNTINPTSLAKEIKSPLLVVHGVNDPRVPFNEAEQIVDRLQNLGRDVWALYVEDEGHSFKKRENADYIHAVEAAFLKKHLLLP